MVALMLVFGVAATIGQPVVKLLRSSYASSVQQLTEPPQGAVKSKRKGPTTGHQGDKGTAGRARKNASEVERPQK
jgi:hypothetical protein